MIRRRRPLLSASLLVLLIIASACSPSAVSITPTAAQVSAGPAGSPTAITLPAGANAPTATPAPTDTPKPPSGTPTPTITPPGTVQAAKSTSAAAQTPPAVAATATAAASATSEAKAAGMTATAGVKQKTAAAPTPTSAGASAAGSGSVPLTSSGGPTATLDVQPSTGSTGKMANACDLLVSSDLASLLPPQNEVASEQPVTSQVSHPAFSTDPAAGMETRCVFADNHQPGSGASWMFQVTYLVDLPAPSALSDWVQAWNDAKTKAGQPVSGLGDDAFTNGTTLYVKKGDTYLTFDLVDTRLDAKDPGVAAQLLGYEKTLASAALARMR